MASSEVEKVILPSTYAELFEQILADGTFIQHHENNTLDQLPPKFQTLLKYSFKALKIGRPLDRCLIAMFGETGTGKSETINRLFEDEICPTNDFTSETRVVAQYSKKLLVTAANPSVLGFISFVDAPGTLDVERCLEAQNFAQIQSYREKNECLATRSTTGIPHEFLRIVRERVYPNLVMLTVSATDKRLIGTDSGFRKTLKSLAQLDIVDREHLNLLVVVTFACSMPAKTYSRRKQECQILVQESVYSVLRIKGVNVIFVDNKIDEHVDKREDSDFYELPDSELSHLNLMKAIQRLFLRTGDDLGLLFSGWYFDSDCPDKKQRTIKETVESITSETNPNGIKAITAKLSELGIIDGPNTLSDIPALYFCSLGQGYCPVTETVKHHALLAVKDMKKIDINGSAYMVPKFLTSNVNSTGIRFRRITYSSKDMYERNRSSEYGLDAGIELIVNVASEGRWVNRASESSNQAFVSLRHETRLMSFRVPDPHRNLKKSFISALKKMPDLFTEENAHIFNEFFSRFGTHLIVEQVLGGEISYDCKVNAQNFDEYVGMEIRNRIGGTLGNIINGSGNFGADRSGYEVESLGVSDETLHIRGGNPLLSPLQSLTEMTPDVFKNWQVSLPTSLVELEQGFKLFPYYNLLSAGSRTEALKEATLKYLRNRFPEREITRRNEFGRRIVNDVVDSSTDWWLMVTASVVGGILGILAVLLKNR